VNLSRWLGRSRAPRSGAAPPGAARPSLFQLLDGYRATCLLTTAVRTGLVERLARGSAPVGRLALDLGLHEDSLARLLRALAALEVVRPAGAGAFELGRLGRQLRDDPFARDLALLTAEEYLPAWVGLRHSVATGENAFEHVFGESAWRHRERHPELNDAFNRLMTRFQDRAAAAIARSFDFSRRGLVVDVGGGRGRVLAGILAAHAHVRGIVFDQPHVVAAAAQEIEASSLGARCSAVGGSFFESVPAGGDVYLLRHVLHDWSDDDCLRILRACRAAMGASSVLLVVESVMPEDGKHVSARHALLDLQMLLVPGGRERSEREYAALLDASGFAWVRTIANETGGDVIEARPR
jgi:hypothetical protein